MALKLSDTVVKFLSDHPEHKFTARDIANWIFETYPDECQKKQNRSEATINPMDSEAALLQQLVAEIGSRRPALQKRNPKIKQRKVGLENTILLNKAIAQKLITQKAQILCSKKPSMAKRF